jgi:hypothetical protein
MDDIYKVHVSENKDFLPECCVCKKPIDKMSLQKIYDPSGFGDESHNVRFECHGEVEEQYSVPLGEGKPPFEDKALMIQNAHLNLDSYKKPKSNPKDALELLKMVLEHVQTCDIEELKRIIK